MQTLVDAPLTPLRIRRLTLERTMVRVRWFGIALGTFQVAFYEPRPGTTLPTAAPILAAVALFALLVLNSVVAVAIKSRSERTNLATLGGIAFATDIIAVYALVWTYNFEELGQTWVLLTVLCLEGALRYQMRGALIPVGLAVLIEPIREFVIGSAYPQFKPVPLSIHISDLTYRVGILAMVGAVAGAIARNLERQRASAEGRAAELAILAESEGVARRESAAFQKVILAGVQAEGLPETLQTMIEQIAADLGYARLCVLLHGEGSLSVVAQHGFAEQIREILAPLHASISGQAQLTGDAQVFQDVATAPLYMEVDPRTRSQASIPIRLGQEVLGVLDVESDDVGTFSPDDVRRLQRLCDQMALVMENARLLSSERQTVERLRQLDAMKSDFIAIASHELRTPLTSLRGAVSTLIFSGHALDEDQKLDMLSILGRQSERLTRLVEDLLSVSQLDAATLRVAIEPSELGVVITDVLEQLGDDASRIRVSHPDPFPSVATDPRRLSQVLRNLVENALKFSPEDGHVTVAARVEGHAALIEITDDGAGIPEDEIPHIFDRFYQVGGSMRRQSDGLGLGLYISRRLLDALNGAVSVRSGSDHGTTFVVRIPLAER